MDLSEEFSQAYLRKHLRENNMKEFIMCMKGNLAELVVMVKPTLYHKYLTHEKRELTCCMSLLTKPFMACFPVHVCSTKG